MVKELILILYLNHQQETREKEGRSEWQMEAQNWCGSYSSILFLMSVGAC
jgi:hypothetical protein